MNVDTGPQDVRMIVVHSKPELWHTTGVCSQSLPLLPTFPHDRSFIHTTNNTVKFAGCTTVVGVIWDNNETAYRDGVRHLTDWGHHNNLDLNSTETKKFIVDSVKSRHTEHSDFCIHGEEVERIEDF